MSVVSLKISSSINIKLSEIVAFYLLFVLIMRSLRYSLPIFSFNKYNKIFIIFMISLIISSTLSDSTNYCLIRMLVFVSSIVIITTFPHLISKYNMIFICLDTLVYSVFLSAVIGIILLVLYPQINVFDSVLPSTFGLKISSYLGDPNRFANFLNMGFSLSLPKIFFNNKISLKNILINLTIFSAIILTGSRAAIFISLMFIFTFLVLKFKSTGILAKKKYLIILILLLSIILLLIHPNSVSQMLYNRFRRFKEGSVHIDRRNIYFEDVRKDIFKLGIKTFQNNPFLGSGPFTFEFDKYIKLHGAYTKATSHNMYLEVLSTSGIIGFLPYISVLLIILIDLIRKKRICTLNSNLYKYYIGLLVGYIGFLIHGFVISSYSERYVWLYITLVISFLISIIPKRYLKYE